MVITETKFTPGPWVACERGDYADDGIVILGDDRRVAVVSLENDARLIAAAPELYEALKEAHRALMFYEWYSNPKSGWASGDNETVRGMVDAALAKSGAA